MAIKESSDELNPSVSVPAVIPTSRPERSAKDYLALAIATCGVGYIPLISGTFGSVLGIGLWISLRSAFLALVWSLAQSNHNLLHIHYGMVALLLFTAVLLTLIGAWAGGRVERLQGAKDPKKVVIDEVAGQLIALIPVPLMVDSWWTIILAFLLFRFFDIVKPYPANKFEKLRGGLGIMADDVVAGIYAAVGVAVAVTVTWFI